MAAASTDPEMTAILRRRAMADALMKQATEGDALRWRAPSSVLGSALQSLAGGFSQVMAGREEEALNTSRRDEASQFMGRLLQGMGGGQGAAPSAASAPQASPQAAPTGGGGIRTGAAVQVPPDMDDVDLLARTLIGEAANQGEEGQRAVAHVVRNRMNQTGASLRDVVLAPNQFEPWGARRQELLAIQPTEPRYMVARNVAQAALDGRTPDPTGGSTHFLNPDLQRQLGRAIPAWAPDGQGQRIGAHVFYSPGGGIRTGQGAPPAPAGVTPMGGDVTPVQAQAPGGAPAQAAGGAPPAGAQMPPRPNLWGMALEASGSRNPQIRQYAPILTGMAGQRPEQPPTVQMVGPQGPGIYERLPNGQTRFLGALPETAPRSQARFEQDRALAEAGRTNVETRVAMEPERAESAAYGASLGQEGERVRTAALQGAATLDSIRQVRAIGAETGRLAPAREALGGWMDALGINSRLVRDARDLQTFNAAASSVILGRQMEQRGVQTEGDAQRMRETFATIRNTTEANDFILRAAEGQSLRAMEQGEFYQRWRQQPGEGGRQGSLAGAAEAWNRYIRETPMVARAGGTVVFLHEWLPAALQRPEINGDREAAMRLWRENASQRPAPRQ